jgi:hypothetical protein
MGDGEHLSAVAYKHGFANFETLWNAPDNGALRASREDPHQLLNGDNVVIAPKRPKTFDRATSARHTFTVHVEKLKLRLEVLDATGKSIAGVSGTLVVDGTETDVTTDGDGVLAVDVPRNAKTSTLELDGGRYTLAIGALSPISEPAGQAGRLMNLGYWYGADDELDDLEALELAVELFQNDRGLTPTGERSSDFVDLLAQAHDNKP